MTRHYTLKNFFRKAPIYLLKEYFLRKGVDTNFNWNKVHKNETQHLTETFVTLDPKLQGEMSRDFQEIFNRSVDGGFIKAILVEANYQKTREELDQKFTKMRTNLEKVFWTFLFKLDHWPAARIFWAIDKIAPGKWHKRRKLPKRPGSVDESTVENLRRSLIDFYQKQEGRGGNCVIESYRRGEEEIFYAYPEDYPQSITHIQKNELQERIVQTVFEVIFVHNDSKGTLDIHLAGDNQTVPELQVLFAQSVLEEEIDVDAEDDNLIYDLQPLLLRNFEFKFPENLEIEMVEIRAMRIRIEGEPWRRLTLEARSDHNTDEIYDLLDRVASKLNKGNFRLDQVQLRVSFQKTLSQRRQTKRSLWLTSPHSCRMTRDHFGERIQKMLVASGIEIESEADVDHT